MPDHFADALLAAIEAKRAPVCVGIDPMLASFPAELSSEPDDHRRSLDNVYTFVLGVLDAVADLVPIVKFQSAYFEQFHSEGVQAYYELIAEAKSRDLLVIGDVKRGDIGSTSTAYAIAHLTDPADDEQAAPDAITINPMLGMDAIEPFITPCENSSKGLFVLVRTSNPGSKDFQDVLLQSGLTWSEHVADTLAARIDTDKLIGQSGFSSIGCVVGATQQHTMQSLRRRLSKSIFLLPGYGAQGATADMTRAAFNADGRGAIISASRSVLYPKPTGDGWQNDIRGAAQTMVDDVRRVLSL